MNPNCLIVASKNLGTRLKTTFSGTCFSEASAWAYSSA